MKKGWKIALISLGSLLGLMVIIVAVACWLIFTPSKLTAIVNTVAKNYLTCEYKLGKVDLTLFKTFPNVGLEVNDLVLVNPIEGSPSDTVAYLQSLTLGVDAKTFVKEGNVIVRQLLLEKGYANLFTSAEGRSNLDIFASSESTEETESSDSSLPQIEIEKVSINGLAADYCDLQEGMRAHLDNTKLLLKGSWKNDIVDAHLVLGLEGAKVSMADSAGKESLAADLNSMNVKATADGSMQNLDGELKVFLNPASVRLEGTEYVTQAMLDRRQDLVTVSLPFDADVDHMSFNLKKATVKLLDYAINLDGGLQLASETDPMQIDINFATDRWDVSELLEVLPPFVTEELKGINFDARLSVEGQAKGVVADGRLPLISAHLLLDKGYLSAPQLLPIEIHDIDADLMANLNLSDDTIYASPSQVVVNHLDVKTGKSKIGVSGKIDDLLGEMVLDVALKGDLRLPELMAFLPDTMPIDLKGQSSVDIKVKSGLDELAELRLDKVKAEGQLTFTNLDVLYDSIHAVSPKLNVALKLPMKTRSTKVKDFIDAHITAGRLNVSLQNMGLIASLDNPDINVGLPNILAEKQPLAAAFDINLGRVNVDFDSTSVYSDAMHLKGSVLNDTLQDNIIKQWHPDVDIDLRRTVLTTPSMPEALRLLSFSFNYQPEVCKITDADIRFGVSDYQLSGAVYDVEDWLSHKAMLTGDVNFVSSYTDVDQLLNIFSGMGTDPDTLEAQRVEDKVPAEANPFIVPKDVNITLNTHIKRCVAFENDLQDLGGKITVNDGVAVLDQIGFVSKAARMQLTAVYKSPRVNHLFVGLDFHLLDIQVEELLDMIPTIDTLVPMLSAFSGKADFHLAADCNLNAFYEPKMSTLLGAAAISGKNLVVMNDTTIATLAKLLQFKNWREKDANIMIDSLSVEATVFRKEIQVYPFLLHLGNYQVCASGRHTLDNACNYHLELIKCPLPIRLAVDVSGKLDSPKIKLGEVRYADLYRPERRNEVESRTIELKKIIRQALEANVKEQTKNL